MYSTTFFEMDLVPVPLPSQVEVSLTTILGLLALIYGIEYGLVGKHGEAPGAPGAEESARSLYHYNVHVAYA